MEPTLLYALKKSQGEWERRKTGCKRLRPRKRLTPYMAKQKQSLEDIKEGPFGMCGKTQFDKLLEGRDWGEGLD